MTTSDREISVLCADDNPHVAEALRLKLSRISDFAWRGWVSSADRMADAVAEFRPDILLLDLDMPGADPLQAAADIARERPDTRIVVFSGHVRPDLIVRALEAGVWGYVSKNDGEDELVRILRAVADGQVVFSPEVEAADDWA